MYHAGTQHIRKRFLGNHLLKDFDNRNGTRKSIFYRDIQIGTRRIDFSVEEKIMVALKAIINLENVHLAQAINYLETYKMQVGMLINFGTKSLKFKRVHNRHLNLDS
jgi:GxxExxY protein